MVRHHGWFISEILGKSVFINYFRLLCDRLINLPLPHDCWNLPTLPLFVYSWLPELLLVPTCFALVFIMKKGLFMHVGSNVKIKISIVLWFCYTLTTFVREFLMSLLIDRPALKTHVGNFSYAMIVHILNWTCAVGIVFNTLKMSI